ncbi:MAG: DNA repair protein RecO [Spirochaetota bacterium]
MSRTTVVDAIVLRARTFGEMHKSITLLTPQNGLVSAIAYGAQSQKGKLRGLVNPFHHGICYLYTNPVKDRTKITDFDVRDYYPGIRESIDRFYAASLWAEVLLKSYAGGGEAPPVYELLLAALGELDRSGGRDAVRRLTAQFLWRYFGLIGSLPQLDACTSCGRGIDEGAVRRFTPFASGVLCTDCAREDSRRLSPGAVRYLRATAERPLRDALSVGLDEAALSGLTRFLHSLAEGILEDRLNTLRTGGGIL